MAKATVINESNSLLRLKKNHRQMGGISMQKGEMDDLCRGLIGDMLIFYNYRGED